MRHSPIQVEVIFLSAGGGELQFRTISRRVPARTDPESVARALWGQDSPVAPMLHSTSWRYDAERVILTYAALPDPDPTAPRRPVVASVSQSEDPARPGHDVRHVEVAAHACRHLTFLLATDDEVAEALSHHQEIDHLLRRFLPDVAGRVDEQSTSG